jgi:hypothetical protein
MVSPSSDRNDNRYGEQCVENTAALRHRADHDLVDPVVIDVPRCMTEQRWHYHGQERGGPAPAWPYDHGNLWRALLDEALATIRAEGVDGLTLREIGARPGISGF